MKIKSFIQFFSLLAISQINAQELISKNPYSIGEIHQIKSGILQEERILNVNLPYYYDKTKSYPVVYVLDGSANEDMLHITGLVQFFNMQFQMPDCIVVGIGNIDRKRDFTFHTANKELIEKYPTTGKSENFINFIEKELQPYIQANYNTTKTKYIIGQSLGGLLATEILLKKPTLFTHYLIVSPSLWWDNESLLKSAKSLIEKIPNTETYVYVAVGGKEDKLMQKEANELATLLQKANLSKLKVDFLSLPEENHATILHQSLNEAFKKLFPYKD